MDYSKTLRAFTASLPVAQMNGHEKFLAVAAHCAQGDRNKEVAVSEMKRVWPKTTIQGTYHPRNLNRADEAGWITRPKNGVVQVTQEGFDHLASMAGSGTGVAVAKTAGLHVFDIKHTHDFDKFLRKLFASAAVNVSIADAYVDETIFDNLLDQIPTTVDIRLIKNKKQGTFDARVARFAFQYLKFQVKTYTQLHDRFLIIDGAGYVIGPSLKDAARKSPALVVSLNHTDSAALQKFFDELWKRSAP